MKQGSVLTYLHSDHEVGAKRHHLGSTVVETVGNSTTADQKYYAYGKQRDTGPVVTEHKFTGQKLDGTGLMYFNARYYDREFGAFISPDTIVPDASSVFDYNRYMMVRGNPLKYNDPTGHDPCGPGANPHCTEYIQGLTTSGCQGNCGVSYNQFLTAKQQYADCKADPEQYAVDQQTLNGDVVGDVEAAKTRLSYGLLYASYFAHKNPDVDITAIASSEILLASMTFLSGNAKDAMSSAKFRGPAAKGFNWTHIFDRHSDTGSVAQQRTTGTVFEGLSHTQIQARVKAAWSNRALMETQTDLITGVSRMRCCGVDPVSEQTVEMWYNSSSHIVETAYPIP